MRRGYDPKYGSREQLRDSAEHGMKVARERDELKRKNDENIGQIQEFQWRIEELCEQLTALEIINNTLQTLNDALIGANKALTINFAESTKLINSMFEFPK